MEACAADLKNKVLIHFTTTTADKVAEYLLYTLTNCGVSHYSFSASAEGIGSETMMINYDSIQIKFSSMDPGVSGTPETVGYNLATSKKL
jgi:type VI secretion system secreted protein Hcp